MRNEGFEKIKDRAVEEGLRSMKLIFSWEVKARAHRSWRKGNHYTAPLWPKPGPLSS